MWIKIMLCTTDTVYSERLARFFDKEYGDKMEFNVCSSWKAAIDFISQYQIDMALFGSEFEQEVLKNFKELPCVCSIVAEQFYTSENCELPRIDKFQKGDKIYKDIFNLYSSDKNVKYVHTGDRENTEQKIYTFISASGGCGTTTIARAYARRCAAYEKVLYLDLGLFNLVEMIEGNEHGMDEIILALKSRRNILPYKLASAVSSMPDRVFTYGVCSNELDLLELNAKDVHNLINGILALSEYQKIIIDIGTSISFKEIELLKSSDMVVYVMDMSDIGKQKYEKFRLFLENTGHKEEVQIIKKVAVFLNKIKQSYHNEQGSFEKRVVGWAPYVSLNSYDEIIDRIAHSDSFSGLEIRDAEY